MSFTKKYDLAVKTGTYQKDVVSKNRYKNVGSLMQDEDGKQFILLDRSFNPAGIINPDHRESVLISMFEPKKQDEAPKPQEDIDWSK